MNEQAAAEALQPEIIIGGLSFLAFLIVYVIALGGALLHILYQLGRLLFFRRPKFDRWLLAGFVPLLLGIGAVAVLLPIGLVPVDNAIVAMVAAVLIGLVATPVFVPIVRAYVERSFSTLAYTYSVLAILALPASMAFVTYFLAWAFAGGDGAYGITPELFVLNLPNSPCSAGLVEILNLTTPKDFADAQENELLYLMQFWVDTTIKAIFLDAFEVYGCSVSTITHRTDNVIMASLVFGYRTFAAAAFLAILIAPFRRRAD
ncbi:MAG: hypothetical protein GC199_01400 [Alphaproteobacteria bacterium]|nr:hypothetical protein [Alphaproteobacteria bacterium]